MTWAARGKAAVAGVGASAITRRSTKSLAAMVIEACSAALDDAGLQPGDVDGVATFPPVAFRGGTPEEGVHTVGVSYLIDHLPGLSNVSWFGECSTGLVASAVIDAVHAIAAGTCRVVLVWRGMGLPTGPYNLEAKGDVGGEAQFFAPYRLFAPVQTHALAYSRYQHRYGATREKMATLALTSRQNAALNDSAVFKNRPLTMDDYMEARLISTPLCLFDCDVPVMGASALVVTEASLAADCRNPPAYILGVGQQARKQERIGDPLYSLRDHMESGGRTAEAVWRTAGLGPDAVDTAQLYDGFAPSALYWLEAAGFCGEGEAADFIQDGRIARDGALPVNTFGGSLSEGRMHGMGHLVEAARQVTGRAGPRQVTDADVSVVFDGSPMLRGAAVLLASGRG